MDKSPSFDTDISKKIADLIAQAAYEMWGDSRFKQILEFEQLSQEEQDRIFNELEVSLLGLFLLHIDYKLTFSYTSQQKKIFAKLKNTLITDFLGIYEKLNTPQILIKQWNLLIRLRKKEYFQDYQLLKEESVFKSKIKSVDPEFQYFWARIETITLNLVSHIRSGSLNHNDPLIKIIQRWIVTLDQGFDQMLFQLTFKPLGEA